MSILLQENLTPKGVLKSGFDFAYDIRPDVQFSNYLQLNSRAINLILHLYISFVYVTTDF